MHDKIVDTLTVLPQDTLNELALGRTVIHLKKSENHTNDHISQVSERTGVLNSMVGQFKVGLSPGFEAFAVILDLGVVPRDINLHN